MTTTGVVVVYYAINRYAVILLMHNMEKENLCVVLFSDIERLF